MNLRKLSGLARLLDIAHPGNLWILVIAAGTCAAVLLWHGVAGGDQTSRDWGTLASATARAGLAVFLAWALCRELDPDRPGAALVGALLAIGGLLVLGPGHILACLVLLLAVRALNRTTGAPPTWLDGVLLLGLGVWVGLDGPWIYLVAAGVALLGDAVLAGAEWRRSRAALAGTAAAFALLFVFADQSADPQAAPSLTALAVAAPAALFLLPAVRAVSDLGSVADATGRPLSTPRVRAGQALALAVALIAALGWGFSGLADLMPLWAAVVATGLFRWLSGSGASRSMPAGQYARERGESDRRSPDRRD